MHSWKDTLDYSSNTMESALQYEKFMNVSALSSSLRRGQACSVSADTEKQLHSRGVPWPCTSPRKGLLTG